jgi:hypothetical protein
MTYLGDDYRNYHKPRCTISIKVQPLGVDIFTQVVVDLGNDNIKSHVRKIKHMAARWQKAWKEHIPEFKEFKFQVIAKHDVGTDERFEKLKKNDRKYIEQHMTSYLNDMYNFSQIDIDPRDEGFEKKMLQVYKHLA